MLKINIKRFFLVVLAAVGYVLLLPCWRKLRKNSLLVLRYHSVSESRSHEVNVKPKIFGKQINYLAKNFNVISLTEFITLLTNEKKIPPKTVLITFDDGYKDNFTNAYSILQKLGASATIFLSVAYIGTGKILPHDRKDEFVPNRILDWQEVKEMHSHEITFGSHSLNHANLGQISLEEMNKEIAESKRVIEENLGNRVVAVSYPYGLYSDFNAQTVEQVKKAGYVCGFTAMYGLNTLKSDLFRLRRIGIEASDNMFTFKAKLNGALDLLILKETRFVQRIVECANRILGV